MKTNLMLILTAVTSTIAAQNVSSPDGRLSLAIQTGAETTYSVTYDGKTVLNPSAVGLVADYADLAKDLKLIKADVEGMGLDMLLGAESVIRQNRPVLLLSIYHSKDELLGIYDTLKKWDLDYNLYNDNDCVTN